MRNWLIGLSVVFVLVAWQGIHLVYTAFEQQEKWEQQGIALAKEKTEIKQIEEVSLYNGKESYIAVEGKNESGIPLIAWFREGRLETLAYQEEQTKKEDIKQMVEKDYPEARLLHVIPGLENNRPLWEVLFLDDQQKFNYYYYDMKTGEFIRSYRLQKAGS